MKKRKITALLLCVAAIFTLTACGSQEESGPSVSLEDTADTADTPAGGDNILIAYFSVPETDGTDTVAGASRVSADGQVMGNNEYEAHLIQQQTGGDLFAIETEQEYPGTHDELLDFAYNEMTEGAGQRWLLRSRTWTATTPFSWDTLTGTRICRCRSTPSWKNMTLAARRSFPLPPTGETDSQGRSTRYRSFSRMPRWFRTGCPSQETMCRMRQGKWQTGWQV